MDRLKPSILVVDDTEANLIGLARGLEQRLPDYDIVKWQPRESEGPPYEMFGHIVGTHTEMVVTDYDLTTSIKGLFGLAIVAWCQSRGVPVGEYSRLLETTLPQEPNLFELRVPTEEETAADFVTGVVNGFRDLRERIEENLEVDSVGGSLAFILATVLKRPYLESQFAAYMSRPNATNAFLVGSLKDELKPGKDEKRRLFTYVLGHVLVNSVLKYPGPILTEEMLCAYLAISLRSFEQVKGFFECARYTGPFCEGRYLYWREDIDDILDDKSGELATEDLESFGEFNRRVVEKLVDGIPIPHDCERCEGKRGGFWCPLTHRAVCERPDCSVPGSSWIPAGAQLCRIERDFFDEWSPILSL